MAIKFSQIFSLHYWEDHMILIFNYFWEREHKRGGGERKRRQCRAQGRVWTLELWHHDLSWSRKLNPLSHPGASKKIVWFLSSVLLMWDHVDWFADAEPSLHLWNSSHSIWYMILSIYCSIKFANILLRILASMFARDNAL